MSDDENKDQAEETDFSEESDWHQFGEDSDSTEKGVKNGLEK